MRMIPSAIAVIAGTLAAAVSLSSAHLLAADAPSVTLSGCLVKSSDIDAYLLTNSPAEPGWLHPDDHTISPDAFGTTGGFTSVIYWLDGDGALKDHVGHRIEVKGDLKGDPKDGQLKIDRKDKWNELEIKSDGRAMKANVPLTAAAKDTDDRSRDKRDVIVRRVAVEKVKMLGAGCAP